MRLNDKEYRIILHSSKIRYIENTNPIGGLEDFIKSSRIGEKIFLPDDKKFYPNPEYLTAKDRTMR